MKQTLQLISLIVTCTIMNSSSAQNEYFSNNASWGVSKGWFEQWSASYVNVVYTSNGDTVINDVTYVKLFEDGISISYYYPGPNDPPGTQSYYNENAYGQPILFGYFRSEDMKMYRWLPEQNEEIILYDFDVEVGDTLFVNESIYPQILVAAQVDSVVIGGEYRKHILTSGGEGNLITNQFVEGVGNLAAGLCGLAGYNISFIGDQLMCYSYNGDNFDLYSSSNQELLATENACEFVLAIDELDPPVIQIFPNPSSDMVSVYFEDRNATTEARILDATGHLVLQKAAISSPMQVSVADWPDGLYFFQLGNARIKFVVKK